MKIVRTTYRFAAAGGRDETRETQRFGAIQAKGNGKPLKSNARALIPQGVNSVELRYTKTSAANLSDTVKPATCQRRNGTKASGGADRSHRRERVQKDLSETWDTRAYGRQESVSPSQRMNNLEGIRRESEGLIVAVKRGNARGAKEPCYTHAFIYEARAA